MNLVEKLALEKSQEQYGHTDHRSLLPGAYAQGFEAGFRKALELDVATVMDLALALRSIKCQPSLRELVRLAKRIKKKADQEVDE